MKYQVQWHSSKTQSHKINFYSRKPNWNIPPPSGCTQSTILCTTTSSPSLEQVSQNSAPVRPAACGQNICCRHAHWMTTSSVNSGWWRLVTKKLSVSLQCIAAFGQKTRNSICLIAKKNKYPCCIVSSYFCSFMTFFCHTIWGWGCS